MDFTDRLNLRVPASKTALRKLRKVRRIPDDYIDFLTKSNGAEGSIGTRPRLALLAVARSQKMKYYCLEPEVAGDTGDNTVADWTIHPPVVSKLHYEMEFRPDDALLATHPCWIATVAAMNAIKSAKLTGATFGDVEVTMVEQLRDFEPDLNLPDFVWLKIGGKPGNDDFGVAPNLKLVVSERALKLLQGLGISHAEVTDYGG
jgi:hypothetical protein